MIISDLAEFFMQILMSKIEEKKHSLNIFFDPLGLEFG